MRELFTNSSYFGNDLVQWALDKQKVELIFDCSAVGDVEPSVRAVAAELEKEYTFNRAVLIDVCHESGGWEYEELRDMPENKLLHKAIFVSVPDDCDLIIDVLYAMKDKPLSRDITRQIVKIYDGAEF